MNLLHPHPGGEVAELPAAIVAAWARRVAVSFPVRAPGEALRRAGVALHVTAAPLNGRRHSIHGAWDPVLRRIELFGVGPAMSDSALVETLGHELWHALAGRRARILARQPVESVAGAERSAQRFAAAWARWLGTARSKECAAALRALIRSTH